MIEILKAEYLKTKRSTRRRIIWVFPMITFALAFVLTLGMENAYAECVWNWWYTLLLPGMTAILCCLSMSQEKRTKDYHLTTLPLSKKKLMMGKILYLAGVAFLSNLILFAGASLGGFLLTTGVPLGGAAMAVVVLTMTQLWSIPLFLFLSESFGMIPALLSYLLLTLGGVTIASTGKWYLLVSAIPMRILCPFLHILPNGLPAEAGSALLDMGVVLPGIALSLLWFVLITVLFLHWFDRREVKSPC